MLPQSTANNWRRAATSDKSRRTRSRMQADFSYQYLWTASSFPTIVPIAPTCTLTLTECNITLSLTSTGDFEVQIDDSRGAVERHALFVSATSPVHTTGSARRCCSGRYVQAGECANARDWMLDPGRQSRRSTHKTTSVLASRCVSNTPSRRKQTRGREALLSSRLAKCG